MLYKNDESHFFLHPLYYLSNFSNIVNFDKMLKILTIGELFLLLLVFYAI